MQSTWLDEQTHANHHTDGADAAYRVAHAVSVAERAFEALCEGGEVVTEKESGKKKGG